MTPETLETSSFRYQRKEIGIETMQVLERLRPDLKPAEIVEQHQGSISTFSFVESQRSTRQSIASLAFPGYGFGPDQFMLQEEPLSALGTFIACEYPPGMMNLDIYLAQAADTITYQKEKGQKVVLQGLSLGGTFAVLAAQKRGVDIDGLILMGTPVGSNDFRASSFKWMKNVAYSRGSDAAARAIRIFGSIQASTFPPRLDEEFRARYRKHVTDISPEALKSRTIAFIQAIEHLDDYRGGPISDLPTLIINPSREQYLNTRGSRLKSMFPNSTEQEVPGSHGTIIHQAESYNRVMVKWIEQQFTDSPENSFVEEKS